MKKKIVLALLVVTLTAGSAFAQISFGAGGFYGADFGGGYEVSDSAIIFGSNRLGAMMPYSGGGGHIFVDLSFLEITLGFYGGDLKTKGFLVLDGETTYGTETSYSISNFNLGAFFKSPTTVGPLTTFWLLGIDWTITTKFVRKADEYEFSDPGDNSALWVKAGLGLDFGLTGGLFLRTEGLYGLRFASEAENDAADYFKNSNNFTRTRLGHGLDVKLALGYKLGG